eukprot:12686513-Alexandrium_andersonii.AAC.1
MRTRRCKRSQRFATVCSGLLRGLPVARLGSALFLVLSGGATFPAPLQRVNFIRQQHTITPE